MYRRKFLPQRPQAIAERMVRIRRLHQLRRVLAEDRSPLAALAGEHRIDDGDRELILRSPLH